MPVYGGHRKGVMSRMATTDIVIHKGKKDEKYQLYVEDYVMSYLKNYKEEEGPLFFYGKRERNSRKYDIYGAGNHERIEYFNQYTLLEEIQCRFAMDMPVFSVKEDSGIYELAGYYIFYQDNEAMQNYMVAHRKEMQYKAGIEEKTKVEKRIEEKKAQKTTETQQHRDFVQKKEGKKTSGLMTIQLAAIFVVLIAIVINSTNSYTKLEDLNQAAVEVFFAMENQEAAGVSTDGTQGNAEGEVNAQAEADAKTTSNEEDASVSGTVLRLSDLDAKFEEENRAVKQENEDEEIEDKEIEENAQNGTGQTTETKEADNKESDAEEAASSQQAFARNFAEYYQIEKGDTLYTISIKLYGDTSKVKEICELNQIKDPDNIKYGQKILLP